MIYLIDFENVANDGLLGLEKLATDSTLIILYSEKNCKLTFSHHQQLEQLKCKKEYIAVNETSKNALDFYLSTYLGYLIATHPAETTYCIVSKDTGFDSVISFWCVRGIKIVRTVNLLNEEPIDLTSELSTILPEHEDDAQAISTLIAKYKTKQGINNALVKEFGSENGGAIYRKIKPLITGKK